jgi:hypothetical protein
MAAARPSSTSRRASWRYAGPGCPATHSATTPRPGLQPRQLPALTGVAQGGRAVVADHTAREAGQDRRADRAARAVRGLPARRGRGAARPVRRDPPPDRPLASAARCGGLTGSKRGAAGAEGRAMRRARPAIPEQPGCACGLGSSGSLRLESAARYAIRLTKGRRRVSFSVPTEPIWGMSDQYVAVVHARLPPSAQPHSQADFSIDLIYSGASFAWAGAGDSDG